MKPNGFENYILQTIYNFKHSVQDRNFILHTNANEIISVKFPKLVAFNFLGLNNKVTDENGNYYDSLKDIIKVVYNGQIRQISDKDKKNIKLQSKMINKLAPITLNNVHSIIEIKNDMYLVMVSENGEIVLRLLKQNHDKISYIVIDLLDISCVNELINADDAYVSIPIRSEYLKKESVGKAKIEVNKLNKNEQFERILELKEFLLDNLSLDGKLLYTDYLSSVPIIKK